MRELRFKKIWFKNFLRFGDKPTEIDFSSMTGLTVVMGNNGYGKSTVLDAISYVLTGKPVRNSQPGKLVNNHNLKNMLVSMTLELGDTEILIERGQKPGVCRFWSKKIGAPGELRSDEFDLTKPSTVETSKDIKDFLKFDNDLLKFMIINSTRVPTFFATDTSIQKRVIENLFSFDQMTTQADLIKKQRDALLVKIASETSKLRERESSVSNHAKMLELAKARSAEWDNKHSSDVDNVLSEVEKLLALDLDSIEEAAAKLDALRDSYLSVERNLQRTIAAKTQQETRVEAAASRVASLEKRIDEISDVDFERVKTELNEVALASAAAAEMKLKIRDLFSSKSSLSKQFSTVRSQIASMEKDENCPECGQQWPDHDSRSASLAKLVLQHSELETEISGLCVKEDEMSNEITRIERSMPKPSMTETELARAQADAENLTSLLDDAVKSLTDETKTLLLIDESGETEALKRLEDEITALPEPELDVKSVITSRARISELERTLERLDSDMNPHMSSLKDLEDNAPGLVDWTEVDSDESSVKHMEFLISVLTRKDSPIRRLVTSKYIPYLNDRMSEYLEMLGLAYTVTFTDELSAEITDFGKSVDPSAISGGEEERVSMALNWSFRDVFEEINGIKIKFSAIDERLDSGLDASGVENSMAILRKIITEKKKDIWLVTHKIELSEYADRKVSVLRVDGNVFAKLRIFDGNT